MPSAREPDVFKYASMTTKQRSKKIFRESGVRKTFFKASKDLVTFKRIHEVTCKAFEVSHRLRSAFLKPQRSTRGSRP